MAHASEPVPGPPVPIVHQKSVLRWVDRNPAGTTAFYIVQLLSADRVIEAQRVEKPEIELSKLLQNANPGEYQLRILSVDQAGISSAPSPSVRVAWVGLGLS